ncbi:hypothetical protein ACN20G_30910 (plasmid) [Streptomyces sp. BI20]|uniref:hypothetical protein n=1 Tax=Streptomyces sp. BI20 TaxID=3403460 RepID=UPI003C75450B
MPWRKKRDPNEGQGPEAVTRRLIAHVLAGERPIPIPSDLSPYPGEQVYADVRVHVQAHYGTTVAYDATEYTFQGSKIFIAAGMVLGTQYERKRRKEAEREAAAQWRYEGEVRLILSDLRLVGFYGSGIEQYPLANVVAMPVAEDGSAFGLAVSGAAPLWFSGPWAPFLCVMLSVLRHGTVWPPGRTFPPALAPAPVATPVPEAPPVPAVERAPARPELDASPPRPELPAPRAESAAEELAERVDRLPPAEAAEVLEAESATRVEAVLDLLGSRKALAIRTAMRARREE